MEAPILLCGMGRVGWRVLESLRSTGTPIVVCDLKVHADDPRLKDVKVITGDCQVQANLEAAGVAEARGIIIVTSDDLVNVATAFLARRLNPSARIVVRMFNESLLNRFGNVLTNTVALSVSALTAPIIVGNAVSGDTLGVVKHGNSSLQISQITVLASSQLVGKPIAQLEGLRLQMLAYVPKVGEPSLLQHIPGYQLIQQGDQLVLCGHPDDLEPHLRHSEESEQSGVRWAGWIRRQLRTVRQTIAEIDTLVQIATGALLLTLFVGTVVFRYAVGTSWGGGLYQTVSVVATGAALHGEDLTERMQTFISVLKIVGAALMASFTAILTQYLLRAKLGGALEARKIPDAGHVVVCGLGNIGFRCVEELVRLGKPVVAIEKVNDNPFAATVRRMGVPVIIGDAAVPEVLRQARTHTARAVIAASASELANLEMALLVREKNPDQRVVIRLNDPDFALAMRETANIRYALAIPALAAPAFVAGLYGDRVNTLFQANGKQLLVVDVIVQDSAHYLNDQTLRTAMIDYSFLPLGLKGQPPFANQGVPYAYRLKPGDHLTVVVLHTDLDPLLRREAPAKNWRLEAEGSTIAQDLSRGQAEELASQSETRGRSVRILRMDGESE